MFLNLIINAIIWIAICKMSFICAKFTTIAQYGWFQDAFFELEKRVRYCRFKRYREKLAQMVLNFSYSKAFYCVPCHVFWLSLIALFFAFRIESNIYAFAIAFVFAFFNYLIALGLEEKPKPALDIEALKNELWVNSRSQYGNYDNDLCLKTKPKNNS